MQRLAHIAVLLDEVVRASRLGQAAGAGWLAVQDMLKTRLHNVY